MNVNMRKFLQRFRTEKVSIDDCQDILDGEMEVRGLPKDDLRYQLFDAFDHLEYLKDKYRRMIVAGEAKGHFYKLDESAPESVEASKKENKQKPFEIRENDARNQLSDIHEVYSEDDSEPRYYYDAKQRPIEIKKRLETRPAEGQPGPSRFVQPSEIQAAGHRPDNIEDPPMRPTEIGFIASSESSDEEQPRSMQVPTSPERMSHLVEREATQKEPMPDFFLGLGDFEQLIERDILHVACQLTDRDPADLPLPFDSLTKTVLDVAKAYKQGVVDREKALELIGQEFWKLPCVPIEFANTFVYHPTNSFFGELIVKDPATNAAVRANLMNARDLRQCEDSKGDVSQLDFSLYATDKTWVNIFKEAEADEIAKELEDSIRQDTANDLDLSLGDVSIKDSELSNSGKDFVAIPESINFKYPSSLITDEEQMALLNSRTVPDQKVTLETLQGEIDALEDRVSFQFNEGERHTDNSKIYAKGIK